MADVTLTVNGLTFTFNEGDVQKVSCKITTFIDQQEVSSLGPANAYLYDYDGVTKTISISGVLTLAATTRIAGYTITTIYSQKQWLESLANGQQTLITFTSTYDSQSVTDNTGIAPFQGGFTSTYVMVQDMSFDETAGDPSELPFNITFKVGQ